MQKTPFSHLLREELTRASIFGVWFIAIVSLGFVSVSYAASSGGLFGDLLNKMLVKSWDDTSNNWTVKNAQKLGGYDATEFVKLGASRSCLAPACMYGIDTSGNVLCR